MGCGSSKEEGRSNSESKLGFENVLSPEAATKQSEQSQSIVFGHSVFNATSAGLSVLLVFPKEDKQTKFMIKATEKMNYHCSLMLLNYSALLCIEKNDGGRKSGYWWEQTTFDRPVDLVIIDRRRGVSDLASKFRSKNNRAHAADSIRQALSNIPEMRHAVMVALIPHRSLDKQEALINSTFNAGFNKYMFEFTCTEDAERELIAFAHNELLLIRKCREPGYIGHIAKSNESQGTNNQDLNGTKPTEKAEKPADDRAICGVSKTPLARFHVDGSQSSLNPVHAHFAENVMDEIQPEVHHENRKAKNCNSILHQRGHSRSIPSSASEALDQHLMQSMFINRKHDAFMRFHNLNATSPLCKVIAILNSSKTRTSHSVAKELQKAIDIICKSDVFANQVYRPLNDQRDPLAADLMEGLMVTVDHEEEKRRFPRSASTGSALRLSMIHNLSEIGLTQEIEACLENDDQWDYDILALEKVTKKRPLRYLAMKVFHKFNVFGVLRIDEPMMMTWLTVIEENYHKNNPYHNATHAADVMQSTAYLMRRDLITSVLDSMDEVSLLLAAVVHDLNHPGRTNPFLVNSNSPLAILYNDLAVLESHHVALTFELTRKDPNINIFKNLSREEYRTIRGYMIDLVLATEMARHFEHVSKFINNLSKPMMEKPSHSSTTSMSSVESDLAEPTAEPSESQLARADGATTAPNLDHLTNKENRAILKRMIIKCSDVNNPTRPLALCKEWAQRIAEEYFCQTEEEKRLGLPIVMPNFDRQTCNIPKSQISFIDFFVKHMFSAFDSVCSIPELMKNLNSNYEYWESLTETETEEDQAAEQK